MDKIIEELDRTVEAHCFLAGLTLALTIPSVCCQVEFSEMSSEYKRYSAWCKKYITDKIITPEEYYALRCAVLHNGNDKLKEQFILKKIGESKDYHIHIPYARHVKYNGDEENEKTFCVAGVIQSIKQAYNKFKEKYPNFTYTLLEDEL